MNINPPPASNSLNVLSLRRSRDLGALSKLPDELLAQILPAAFHKDLFVHLHNVSPYARSLGHQFAGEVTRANCAARIEGTAALSAPGMPGAGRGLNVSASDKRSWPKEYVEAAIKYFVRLERIAEGRNFASLPQSLDRPSRMRRARAAAALSERWPKSPCFAYEAYVASSVAEEPNLQFMARAIELGSFKADQLTPSLTAVVEQIEEGISHVAQPDFIEHFALNIRKAARLSAPSAPHDLKFKSVELLLGYAFRYLDRDGLYFDSHSWQDEGAGPEPEAFRVLCKLADLIMPTKNAWVLRVANDIGESRPPRQQVEARIWELLNLPYQQEPLAYLRFEHENSLAKHSDTFKGSQILTSVLLSQNMLDLAEVTAFELRLFDAAA